MSKAGSCLDLLFSQLAGHWMCSLAKAHLVLGPGPRKGAREVGVHGARMQRHAAHRGAAQLHRGAAEDLDEWLEAVPKGRAEPVSQ